MPKAVVCRELGPPESLRLETFAAVPLAAGQVRVAIRAAGINFPDILMVEGKYQVKPELPFIPGLELAGVVLECHRDIAHQANEAGNCTHFSFSAKRAHFGASIKIFALDRDLHPPVTGGKNATSSPALMRAVGCTMS